MQLTKIIIKYKQHLKSKSLALSLLAFIASLLFYVPIAQIGVDVFHNDDVRLINQLSSINNISQIFQYLFSIDFFKFRPVANAQYFLEYVLFGSFYNAYVIYNCLLVSIIVFFVLKILDKNNNVISILIVLCICLSKFIIFGLWNIAGSFELLSAIFFIISIISILNNNKNNAIIFCSLLILTSEKFLPFVLLIPIFFNYYNGNDSKSNFLTALKYSFAIMALYFVARFLLGVPLIVGTQTDDISSSFNLFRSYKFLLAGFFELGGVSLGPRYLTGLDFPDWVPLSALIANAPFLKNFLLGALLFLSFLNLLLAQLFNSSRKIKLLLFISLVMLLPASVTFRLELRWLLPSFLALILALTGKIDSVTDPLNNQYKFSLYFGFLKNSFIILLCLYSLNYAYNLRKDVYFAGKLSTLTIMGVYK